MSQQQYRLQCRCGLVKGRIEALSPAAAVRVSCHCRYCADYLRHLGQSPVPGTGVDLFITMPDLLKLDDGHEHIRCLKLSNKGPLRFYAGCCNTPLASTMANLNIPFASVSRQCVPEFQDEQRFADGVGAHVYPVYLPESSDVELQLQEKSQRSRLVRSVGWQVIKGLFRGASRKSPFRGKDGLPVTLVYRVKHH